MKKNQKYNCLIENILNIYKKKIYSKNKNNK